MNIHEPDEDAETREGIISAQVPDWRREARQYGVWAPSKALLACVRSYQRSAASASPLARIRKTLAVLLHRYWSAVTGADIPLGSNLGGGLLLPHPNGVVIHPKSSIGPNCLMFQQVTIGAGRRPGLPRIGGHVDIGAGAKILGGVTIGDHAKIGANAVVLDDVPAGATAVGIPARILPPATAQPQGTSA
jgi:serine O-acetyltransferase